MNEKRFMGTDVTPLLAITTLSGLVSAIVHAGQTINRDDYLPYAYDWHAPNNEINRVEVCDAGAVLATLCHLSSETHVVITNEEFEHPVKVYLDAIERIRIGNFHSAAAFVHIELTLAQNDVLDRIEPPRNPNWTYHAEWGTPESIEESWDNFDLHITDLRDRVLPALKALGL